MIIIGCDFHTRYQQIAMADDKTGEILLERRLDHGSGEAHAFYRNFSGTVLVGIEAIGPIHWSLRNGLPNSNLAVAVNSLGGNATGPNVSSSLTENLQLTTENHAHAASAR